MQRGNQGVLLSASDLMRFAGCAHATTLDLGWLEGKGPAPEEDSADAALLQRHGDAHEARHLARLRAGGRSIVEIARDGVTLADAAAMTRSALQHGADVVFQGALAGPGWGGWSDFLERVERPASLGSWSYEVTDTKLKRRPHPRHVLQLALYSDLLAAVQGALPERAHVELGDGSRATIRLSDVAAYARRVRTRLEAFVADRPPTRPVPCADCPLCRWRTVCSTRLAEEDSLFRVANVTRGQVAKLEAAGVTTMTALAARTMPVRGMAAETLERLVAQARLQANRPGAGPAYALRPPKPGCGFDLLPAPDPGDVFYDIEGDPFFEGGLEYPRARPRQASFERACATSVLCIAEGLPAPRMLTRTTGTTTSCDRPGPLSGPPDPASTGQFPRRPERNHVLDGRPRRPSGTCKEDRMETSTLVLEHLMIRKLKRCFALRFPDVKPTHRTELAARGLGYRTYASLLAALRNGPVVIESIDAERAVDFARATGLEVDPGDVRLALIELLDVGANG